jgi:hypothetical protein
VSIAGCAAFFARLAPCKVLSKTAGAPILLTAGFVWIAGFVNWSVNKNPSAEIEKKMKNLSK